MKFRLNEVFAITRSLPKLTDKELPIKISYRLLKFLKSCSEEMETLEKSRVKLIKKYAEKSVEDEKDDGKKKNSSEQRDIKVADENKDKFQEEFSILLNEEVEIDFEPICIEDFGEITFATNDLISLQKIIKEK